MWAGQNLTGSAVGDGNPVIGVTANNGVVCTIEPSVHEAWCSSSVGGFATQKFSSAIGTPVALDMTSACSGNMVWALDGQGDGTNPVLYSFSVGTDGTLTNERSLPLPGFTPASKFTQSQLNNFVNWQVSASQSSCTVAIMGSVLNALTGDN